MRRKQVALLLKKRSSLDDGSNDPEVTHHHSIILDVLDEMDLMEVDDELDRKSLHPLQQFLRNENKIQMMNPLL
ncbi:hypothetical protein AZE42_11609 [Rhizopogon vesiculosus]|uniref:Uncharacterized protein n=1 Tax=Rhizopogon vesiculosus TaxID=180088 RepID=A0A1J8QLC9_9AGAM|nr:hypothetical protein AZE42_11609 [Rhizopogon vesiculosus]